MNEKASEEILKVEQKYNLLRRPFFREAELDHWQDTKVLAHRLHQPSTDLLNH